MRSDEHRWIVFLAAGDGNRVRGITRDAEGRPVPKQFWRPDGRTSLLRITIERAARLAPVRRQVAVVARDHRRWWEPELADFLPENVVVQPDNRGTAAGVLLPVLDVLARDPGATVVILPTDHWVCREMILTRAILDAFDVAEAERNALVLVGMVPDACESECGWIVPAGEADGSPSRAIRAFVEKPDDGRARRLMGNGALLNSMILAASGNALVRACERHVPELVESLVGWVASRDPDRAGSLERVYAGLRTHDFSREVLQPSPERLRVVPVAGCGWTDVGTPARLAPLLARTPGAASTASPAPA